MSVYRVQLKPSNNNKTYHEILEFCKKEGIVGVGWGEVRCTEDSYEALNNECKALTEKGAAYEGDKGVFKAVNAIRQMKPGDYVWTREGGSIANYYLCKVNNHLWKDRVIKDKHRIHDVVNFVGCEWAFVGTEEKVPGKVVNAFRATATAQQIYYVDQISDYIWKSVTGKKSGAKERLSLDDFWNLIGPEELECLVLLYFQSQGYYVYTSTVKNDTKTYEAILIHQDGTHLCYPQVKQNTLLEPADYAAGLSGDDKAVLFSSSEEYGKACTNVDCLSREEIWKFIQKHYNILPASIKYWVDCVEKS